MVYAEASRPDFEKSKETYLRTAAYRLRFAFTGEHFSSSSISLFTYNLVKPCGDGSTEMFSTLLIASKLNCWFD